jgi:site-specific DNA recombinase
MIIYDKHGETRKTIRAVIYIRFSSKQQAESFSIEYQEEECLKYIESKGYKYVTSYVDKAKTGKKTAGREALEQMIYDAGLNKFDRIIVFSFSRSFRNTRDALNTNHELMSKHGITIESVIEPIDLSSPHGKFSGTNLFAMHELQSDIIAAHVRSGMYIAAKQGYYLGGHINLGYDVYETNEFTRGKPRKKYCIKEEDAQHIRMIFKMFLDGYSMKYIAEELRRLNVRVSNGGELISEPTIGRILRKRFYIGTREFDIKGYEKIEIENAVPAIIDVETFNAVQEKLEQNKNEVQPRKRNRRFYALTGKVTCACCNGHYCGIHIQAPKGRKAQHGNTYYVCYNKRAYKTCNAKNVRKDKLEEYCVEQIKKHILTPEKIKEISAYILSQTDDTPAMIKEELKAVEKRKRVVMDAIKQIEAKKIEASVTNNAAMEEVYAEMIADYSKELTDLNGKLARLENIDENVIDAETVENYLNECLLKINSSDPQILKTVFDKLIEKVVIHDDKVELFLVVFPLRKSVLNVSNGCPSYSLSTTTERKQFMQR